MKLIEALKTMQKPAGEGARPLRVFLACGFTPLHLQTFLGAHLRVQGVDVVPEIRTGLFGDLIGSLERLDRTQADVVAVVLEWSDLDPRLGIRSLGGWGPADLEDIAASTSDSAVWLEKAIEKTSRDMTVVVSMPTLPLPPAFITRPVQLGAHEARVRRVATSLAESLSQLPRVRVVSGQHLDQKSPVAVRYDVKADLQSGFPYSLEHASALGELLAGLIHNRVPMKGIITDLDDTLWSGIVGDDGVEKISWSLDGHSQMHGVYQQVLSSLANSGVLVAVASKNDEEVVRQAFKRKDILISSESIYPLEVHWSLKSESVKRILAAWNIGADAVVFIDDNPAEIAEVQMAFPEMQCRQFLANDPRKIWDLMNELRDLFGRPTVSKEDAIRMESIRSADAWRATSGTEGSSPDELFRSADPCIVFDFGRSVEDSRAFELVNKTNQFNLNGIRYTEAEWRRFFDDPNAFLLTASYEDKFGDLGKIAVLMGTIREHRVQLKSWVMSCRAFSRRIEHQCLRCLLEDQGAHEIEFEFVRTPRNSPLKDFIAGMMSGDLSGTLTLTKERFEAVTPQLFHRVEVNSRV